MLVFARKLGQRIRIRPDDTLPLDIPIGVIFANGPIEIVVSRITDDEVSLGFTGPPSLLILREERDRK